ncbi:MAG: hypothetical protein C5B54_10025 [Acidobacteria bacterium]|nr:MAG: hypothetical protein C5B54_10025 [Acidobacteriota bacterium]
MKLGKGDLSGFIDRGVTITGTVEFENTLRIDGKLVGKIHSNDLLIIGEHGEVDGEIDVAVVSVTGLVKGKIYARQRLEIQKGGRVLADVVTPKLMLIDGGVLQGKCEMGTDESKD